MSSSVDDAWDDFVKQNNGYIFQSALWRRYVEKIDYKSDRVIVENDRGEIVGGLFFYTNPLNYGFTPSYTWYYGPLVKEKNVISSVLKKVDERARVGKIYAVSNAFPAMGLDEPEMFQSFNYETIPIVTFIVDLTQPKDVLWKNVKKEARHNIRGGAEKAEVEEVTTRDGLKEYLRIYLEGRRRLGFEPIFSMEKLDALWESLHPEAMKIFIARMAGNPIAGIIILFWNGHVYELSVAESDYSRETKVYPNDLLKWHVIEWGNTEGLKTFNLACISTTDPNDSHYRFKAKFGGQLFRFNWYKKYYPSYKLKIRSVLKKMRLK